MYNKHEAQSGTLQVEKRELIAADICLLFSDFCLLDIKGEKYGII